jgi:MoxR-like ATPase
LENYSQVLKNIADNVEKVIVGKRRQIELVVCALLCKGHVLIEDVPGVGKTSLVSALAKSVGCSFRRIQFTPDILPSDITGFSMYNQKTGEFEYRQGAVMSQIVLADEINRTSPKTQASLLEAMEESRVTVDGTTYDLPKPFIVLATQNPVEYLGTYPLPEAQLDRFFVKVTLGYPEFTEETKILTKHATLVNPLETLGAVAGGDDVLAMQRLVTEIYVDQKVNDYIVTIVTMTRTDENVALGGSPRASICLYKAAQANAFLAGRDYVVPDDVQRMAPHVLEHRLMMRQEAKLKKITPAKVVERVLKTAQVVK